MATSRDSSKVHACSVADGGQLAGCLALMIVATLAVLCIVMASHPTRAETPTQLPAIEAGAQTRGGVARNASILIVSNLADRGPGSFRAAVESNQPRVIVFAVAGVVWLRSDLVITSPFITIAGQTAPSPGITIQGAKLSVRTHNVIIQHLAVRPGGTVDPNVNRDRDAITIGSCSDCRQPTQDVRLENVSASWGVDEVIGIWGDRMNRVTLRNSIIAEGLNQAGHPKGRHSMGLLIGRHAQSVTVAGNLFASNMRRNPVISAGSSVIVANNFIYNAGRAAIHFYPGPLIRASVIGNVVQHGPSSKSNLAVLQAPRSFIRRSADALIFADDNRCCTETAENQPKDSSNLTLIAYPPVKSAAWQTKPSSAVWQWVKRHAGARPRDRDQIDQRLVSEVESNTGSIINRPEESGGPLVFANQFREPDLPEEPFAVLQRSKDLRRIEAWLCQKHLEVGGPPTPECPQEIDFYHERLTQ